MAEQSCAVDLDQLLLNFEAPQGLPAEQSPSSPAERLDAVTPTVTLGPELSAETTPAATASSAARDDGDYPLSPARVAYLRLALVEGVGPRTMQFLLARFGTAEAVLKAPTSLLQEVPRIGPILAQRIASAPTEEEIHKLVDLCRQEGIAILAPSDSAYPALLRQLADPPAILFVKGELRPEDILAVAIVGTRHPTPYGLKQAERLAAGLAAAGFTIVSGLARGIDAAAHRGALNAGGRTLGVLASGVLRIYPPEHKDLAAKVTAQGALLSESRPHEPPLATHFPKRNRIISGLAWGTIVVEAGTKSGALITAQHALQQNREVFAVPGRADEQAARGCHQLIRDGATMVLGPEDVIEVLRPMIAEAQARLRAAQAASGLSSAPQGGVASPAPPSPQIAGSLAQGEVARPVPGNTSRANLPGLSESEQLVLQAIGCDPTSIDQIVAATGLPTSEVLATISLLELRQLLRRLGGNWVARR